MKIVDVLYDVDGKPELVRLRFLVFWLVPHWRWWFYDATVRAWCDVVTGQQTLWFWDAYAYEASARIEKRLQGLKRANELEQRLLERRDAPEIQDGMLSLVETKGPRK